MSSANSNEEQNPSKGFWDKLVVALWVLPIAIISIRIVAHPWHRSVTPEYFAAAAKWGAKQNLYDFTNIHAGLKYLPQFALLYWPFYKLGVAGDILWRWVGLGLVAFTLDLACRPPGRGVATPKQAALMSIAVVPVLLGAMSKGQANLHLAGLFVLAAWFFSRNNYTGAAVSLWVAMALKPLALLPMLLAAILFPQSLLYFVIGLPLFLAAPFLCLDIHYASTQLANGIKRVLWYAGDRGSRFADINGLLHAVGLGMSATVSPCVRGLGLVGALMAAWKLPVARESGRRALMWLGLSTISLLLLNPLTEANSYCILAPVLGIYYIHLLMEGQTKQAAIIMYISLSLGFLGELLRPLVGNAFDLAWDPLMAIVVLAMLVKTRSLMTPADPEVSLG